MHMYDCLSLSPDSNWDTLLTHVCPGLMNAADYYGLDELRKACMAFVSCCINVDTVCALLASAERYIQYKCTKSLVQRVSRRRWSHDALNFDPNHVPIETHV